MRCPQCGKELESGMIYAAPTAGNLVWTSGPGPRPLRRPKDALRLCPVGEDPNESPLAPKALSTTHFYHGSMLCRACGLVVIPYQVNE